MLDTAAVMVFDFATDVLLQQASITGKTTSPFG